MQIQTQVQLKPFNTLNLEAIAAYYSRIQSTDDLIAALEFAEQQQLNVLILSGGSNMLLPEQIDALVLHMNIQGIEMLEGNEQHQFLRVGGVKFGMTSYSGRQNRNSMVYRIWP